jgi:hypothetical protein
MTTRKAIRFPSVLALAIVLLLGCGRSEPPAKPAVENESPPTAVQPSPTLPPGHPSIDMSAQTLPPGAMAQAGNPQWTVPEAWQAGKPSSMRRGSFVVSGSEGQTAEIAVTVFPGDVGGMLANINRWRGQIGLGPVTAAEADRFTTKIEVNGIASSVVDFGADKPAAGSTHPQRMIVATVPHEGNSWFFKMTGDTPLVEAQKEAFLQFVKSVKF